MDYSECGILQIPDDANNKKKRSLRLHNAKVRGTHTKEQWALMVGHHHNRCAMCGSCSLPVERDHIVPLYQGGSDCINNLQPICARCNSSKGPSQTDYRKEGWERCVFGERGC
jgi:5-methylcytosine-specific restriction endonuclease McrA